VSACESESVYLRYNAKELAVTHMGFEMLIEKRDGLMLQIEVTGNSPNMGSIKSPFLCLSGEKREEGEGRGRVCFLWSTCVIVEASHHGLIEGLGCVGDQFVTVAMKIGIHHQLFICDAIG